MLRAIIVEDEPASRDRLRRLLSHHADVVTVVAEADSGPAAVEEIRRVRPDLLFLDVSLPGFDGFDVLHETGTECSVIVTTAHAQHAVRAFGARAVHYLLKPIDPAALAEAVARVPAPPQRASAPAPALARILCRDRDTTHVVRLEDTCFLKSEQGYTLLQTATNEYLSDEPLSALEGRLSANFQRVHRNAIVNLDYVDRLRHVDGELRVVLSNALELPVSRRHMQQLRERLEAPLLAR